MTQSDTVPGRPYADPVNPLMALPPVEGQPQYVRNPHLLNTVLAGVMTVVSAGCTVWAARFDNPYAPLLFAATMAAAVAAVVFLRRFNAWDDDCTEPVDTV